MSSEKPTLPGSTPDRELLSAISRRRFLGGAAAAAAGIAATSLLTKGVDASPIRQFGLANYLAQTLPDDANAEQTYIVATDPSIPKVLDFYEAVYERPGVADLFSEPLVRINRNFEIIPGAAESWTSDETGAIWTFKIVEGRNWSDGNPVTANDWVETFQYAADPAHAWDFTWFFDGVLKNWHQAIAGEVAPEEIGVRLGANDYEVIFEAEAPAPYLPSMLLYSLPLSKVGARNLRPALQHQAGNARFLRSIHPRIMDAGRRDRRRQKREIYRLARRAGHQGRSASWPRRPPSSRCIRPKKSTSWRTRLRRSWRWRRPILSCRSSSTPVSVTSRPSISSSM